MKNLKIIKLSIDSRVFYFNPGINLVVGSNATGKTTTFRCIKHALGLSLDLPFPYFRKIDLIVKIGSAEYCFTRENGTPLVHIESDNERDRFRALSEPLNEFLKQIFEPKFAIGTRLTSIFPILEFCFFSDEDRPTSKLLSSGFRLICGANDKLIAAALNDVEILQTQIRSDENFLRKNDQFVNDFLANLGNNSSPLIENIERALKITRDEITHSLTEKQGLLDFSSSKIKELRKENETQYSFASQEIERTFIALGEEIMNLRAGSLKIDNVLTRRSENFSYGQTLTLDFLFFLSVARKKSFIDLNMPNLYINDSMGSRSLDSRNLKDIDELLVAQAGDDQDFQYIEFTHSERALSEFVVANLNTKER